VSWVMGSSGRLTPQVGAMWGPPGVGRGGTPPVATWVRPLGAKDYGGKHDACFMCVITCYGSVVCLVLLVLLVWGLTQTMETD